MSGNLTREITQVCDQLEHECNHLLGKAEHLDFEVVHLGTTARYSIVQTSILRHAQAGVERQRNALAWRFFWSKLRPGALAARLGDVLAPRRH